MKTLLSFLIMHICCAVISAQVKQEMPTTITARELTGGRHEPLTGSVQWDLSLAPTSGQEIRLGYTVRFPAKERVFLD